MKRKSLATTAALLSLLIFSSCSPNLSFLAKKDNSQAPAVKTANKDLGKPKDEKDFENQEIKSLVDDIEVNLSDNAEINVVQINSIKFDVNDYKILSNFTSEIGLEYNAFCNADIQTDDYIFKGNGYSKIVKEGHDLSYGTVVFIEAVSMYDTDTIIPDMSDSFYLPSECYIKGIGTTLDESRADFQVRYYGGIETGNSRNSIEEKIGQGTVTSDNNIVIYKNHTNTMIIVYKDEIASEIYLYADNIMPLETESEED